MNAREEELIARALLADPAQMEVCFHQKRWAELAAIAANPASGMSRLPGVEFKYVCDVWEDRGVGIMTDLNCRINCNPGRKDLVFSCLDFSAHPPVRSNGLNISTPFRRSATAKRARLPSSRACRECPSPPPTWCRRRS